MPVETNVELWYDFTTQTFQTTPVMLNFQQPPDKMTQEEWRFVKILANLTKTWWISRRTGTQLYDIRRDETVKMKSAHDTMRTAFTVACLFGDAKRVKVLYEYATKHHRAALYYAMENRV